MNKKYLSALLFGAMTLASTGTFTSCKDYDDDIDNLSQRVEAVEKATAELQKQISAGAVITSVDPTAKGVKVTLSNGKQFEITNGLDGKNGADGKSTIIEIGENGNWFINGEDTGKPSRGDKGDKGDQGDKGDKGDKGDQGEAGKPGESGKPGDAGVAANGTYYYPGTEGVEDGFWVKVSVDAEGKEVKEVSTIKWCCDENKGVIAILKDDALILKNVAGAEGDVVVSLSADLKSLVFQREFVLDGQNAMEYPYIPYKAVSFKATEVLGELNVVDPNACDNLVQTKESFKVYAEDIEAEDNSYVNPVKEELYHMNPNFTKVDDFKDDLTVVSDDVDFLETRSANNAASKPTAKYIKHDTESGMLTVGYRMAGQNVMDQAGKKGSNKLTSIALQANFKDTAKDPVTSTYGAVYASQRIVGAIAYQEGNVHTQNIGDAHSEPTYGLHLFNTPVEAAMALPTVKVAYNNQNGINLHELLSVHFVSNSQRETDAIQSWNTREELAAQDLYYDFDKVRFTIGDNKTSQSAHCLIENDADITKDAILFACGVSSQSDVEEEAFTDEQKKANAIGSIGRTPLIRVALVNNNGTVADKSDDQVVKVAYMKIQITAPETPKWVNAFDFSDYFYSCLGTQKTLQWHSIETKLLEDLQIKMSREEFVANYKPDYASAIALKQYYKTDKKDVNGQVIFLEYPNDLYLGHINMIKDNGAESTDVLGWGIFASEFDKFRTIDANDIQAKDVTEEFTDYETVVTYTRYVKFTPKDNLNHGISKEPIYMPMKVTMKYPKGKLTNKIAGYWYDTNDMNAANIKGNGEDKMKEIHLNVEAPETKVDGKPAACDFVNDLDDAFILNVTAQHKVDGEAVEDNSPMFNVADAANFSDFTDKHLAYFYYFTANNEGKTVQGISGKSYTLDVANTVNYKYINYPAAYVSTEVANDKIYANGELIATIDNETGKVTYQQTETAKDLLNNPKNLLPKTGSDRLTSALTVQIGVAAYNGCGMLLPLENNTFNAKFLRPVYVSSNDNANFTDAVDGKDKGAWLNLADFVNFIDWREREFAKNISYYAYYGVESITVDVKEIQTNISGTMLPLSQVSNGVEFHLEAGNGKYATATTMDAIRKAYGKLIYHNKTNNVVAFDIIVPVKVTYKWGTVVVNVKGSVNRSTQN